MRLANPWAGLRGLPTIVWVVFATTLVNRAGTMVLPFLVLYMTQDLGFRAEIAGMSLTVYGLGALVSAPLAGRLCDRIGALRVMQLALLLAGVLLLAIPAARQLPAVLGLVLAWAMVGEGVRPASLAAVTGSIPPDQRKAAVALNRLAINLGMSVGPAVGGFLAMASFPLLFLVDGLTSIAAGLVLTVLIWCRRIPVRDGEGPPSAQRLPGGDALRDPSMLALLFGVFLVGVVFLQHEGSMPLFLVRDLYLPTSAFGLLFALNTLLIVLLEVPLNLAMSHWPHRRALTLGALLCSLGFGAMALVDSFFGVALTVVIWTFGEMIFYPVSATYVSEQAPPDRRGEYLGTYSMTFGFAMLVGPWTGTLLLERFGAQVLWSAMLLLGIVATVVIRAATRPAAQAVRVAIS